MRTLLIVLAVPTTVFAQDYFPGKHADLFVGHSFIAAPKDIRLQEYGYRDFSTKLDDGEPLLWEPMPYSSLQGDTMKCTAVNAWEGQFGDEHRILDLVDQKGRKLYYFYDPKYRYSLDLIPVDDLRPPAGYYCCDVNYRVDRFDDSETWMSEVSQPVEYMKEVKGPDTLYFAFLRTTVELPNTGDDVVLILKSGKRLNLTCPMVISVADDATYQAKSTCRLKPEQIATFISDPISEFRIFLYEQRVPEAESYSDMLNCMLLNKH